MPVGESAIHNAGVGPSFRIAEVHLFDTCTHRCGYCGLAERGQVLNASQLEPFRDRAFIERVAAFFNSRTTPTGRWLLQFTGGEPLLTPNLKYLCTSLFAQGNRVAFYTALLLPEGHSGFRFLLDSRAPDVDYIMASLHPEAELDEATFFRKIELLRNRGHNVIVRFVGHPARLSRLEVLDARCRDLGACFYPTTLLSNTYPQSYSEGERTRLSSFFSSLSQHIQLRGGLRTDELRCHGGNRLIAVNLQTGNITPCITVNRPSLGNVFEGTLELHEGLSVCPVPDVSCLCDIHYQQAIVDGVDDSEAFEAQKRGYVPPGTTMNLAAGLAHLTFYTGTEMGIGNVDDDRRLFFTKEEVKARWKALKSGRPLPAAPEPKDETILIFQMGKVGSQTIERTVRALRPEAEVVRTHFLELSHYDGLIPEGAVGTPSEFRASLRRQKAEALAALALLHSRRGGTVKVVTACREPVAHYVAGCFQNISFLIPGSEHLAVDACVTKMHDRLLSVWQGMTESRDAESTQDRFMRMLLRIGHHWFDEELRDVLGIDVYAVPFQPDQGYVVFSQQGMDVLVYRFEDGPGAMERGLEELFGIDSVSVLSRNRSSSKDYYAAYAEFRRRPALPPEFLDERYDAKCVRHFYSAPEIARLRRLWSQTDLQRDVGRSKPSNHVVPAQPG